MAHDLVYRGINDLGWNLYGRKAGAQNVAILDHAKGLYMPPARVVTSAAAWQIGSTARKVIEDQRVVELDIGTKGVSGREHERTESDWWASWSLHEEGKLECYSWDGDEYRWLDVRLFDTPDSEWSIHPDVNHFIDHGMKLLACNPAWQGGTRAVEVSGSGVLEVPISNLTDRPTWLNISGTPGVWKLQDALSSRMVPMPALSQMWKIYTDPQVRTLEVDDASALWPKIMNGVSFTKAIPAGTQPTTWHAEIAGSGTILVEMVDQYSRPWG